MCQVAECRCFAFTPAGIIGHGGGPGSYDPVLRRCTGSCLEDLAVTQAHSKSIFRLSHSKRHPVRTSIQCHSGKVLVDDLSDFRSGMALVLACEGTPLVVRKRLARADFTVVHGLLLSSKLFGPNWALIEDRWNFLAYAPDGMCLCNEFATEKPPELKLEDLRHLAQV